VGIAYQPFILMLIALQCGLWSYCRRLDRPVRAPVLGEKRKMVVAAAS
jgi:hypothetical protein